MSRENAERNLRKFADDLNMVLAFDSNSTCILGIDDEFSLHLTYVDGPHFAQLFMYSPLLDSLPADPSIRLKLFERLLVGSMLGHQMAGGGVGIAPVPGLILIHVCLPMGGLADEDTLKNYAPFFVATVEKWRAVVAAIVKGEEPPPYEILSENEARMTEDRLSTLLIAAQKGELASADVQVLKRNLPYLTLSLAKKARILLLMYYVFHRQWDEAQVLLTEIPDDLAVEPSLFDVHLKAARGILEFVLETDVKNNKITNSGELFQDILDNYKAYRHPVDNFVAFFLLCRILWAITVNSQERLEANVERIKSTQKWLSNSANQPAEFCVVLKNVLENVNQFALSRLVSGSTSDAENGDCLEAIKTHYQILKAIFTSDYLLLNMILAVCVRLGLSENALEEQDASTPLSLDFQLEELLSNCCENVDRIIEITNALILHSLRVSGAAGLDTLIERVLEAFKRNGANDQSKVFLQRLLELNQETGKRDVWPTVIPYFLLLPEGLISQEEKQLFSAQLSELDGTEASVSSSATSSMESSSTSLLPSHSLFASSSQPSSGSASSVPTVESTPRVNPLKTLIAHDAHDCILRYVFIQEPHQKLQAFKKQVTNVCLLSQSMGEPVVFIAQHPTEGEGQYLVGVIQEKDVLLIDPRGGRYVSRDFLSLCAGFLVENKREKIFFSTNELQKSEESSTIICSEIARWFLRDFEKLRFNLRDCPVREALSDGDERLSSIDIGSLLSPTLNQLSVATVDTVQYLSRIQRLEAEQNKDLEVMKGQKESDEQALLEQMYIDSANLQAILPALSALQSARREQLTQRTASASLMQGDISSARPSAVGPSSLFNRVVHNRNASSSRDPLIAQLLSSTTRSPFSRPPL